MFGRGFGPGPFIHEGWHGWAGLVFMGLGLLFWVLVITLVVWLVTRFVGRRSRGAAMVAAGPAYGGYVQPSAMETLRQRYARGEIDATTFDQMSERLRASEGQAWRGEPPTAPLGGDIEQA